MRLKCTTSWNLPHFDRAVGRLEVTEAKRLQVHEEPNARRKKPLAEAIAHAEDVTG